MNIFKEAADIKTADTLDLPRPNAVFHTIVAKPTEIQRVSKNTKRAVIAEVLTAFFLTYLKNTTTNTPFTIT